MKRVLLALTAMGVGACNILTGSSDYEFVNRCTGELCGTCPAGQRFEPVTAICVAECSPNTTACGLTCCEHDLNCVKEASGAQRCTRCEKAEDICGGACCEAGSTCIDAELGVCASEYGVVGQSCSGGLDCGGGTSCCESIAITGGTFLQGSPDSDKDAVSDEKPERSVTVSSYSLDKYEVTVGRFRKFIEGWDHQPPPAGAGAHPKISDSGWHSAWNTRLPKAASEWTTLLDCAPPWSTWPLSKGAPDSLLPINCLTWYEAFAFCVWDGGRLPTEAEWEYAAAGGDENRMFPWGSADPTDALAVYQCAFGGTPHACYDNDIAPVASKASGVGRWGHLDQAGNLAEWTLDVYDDYPTVPGSDFAKTDDVPVRAVRGGAWGSDPSYLRSADRGGGSPAHRDINVGFRCARGQ